VVAIVKKTGALDVAKASARAEAARAMEAARRLPANDYSSCLINLAEQLLERNH